MCARDRAGNRVVFPACMQSLAFLFCLTFSFKRPSSFFFSLCTSRALSPAEDAENARPALGALTRAQASRSTRRGAISGQGMGLGLPANQSAAPAKPNAKSFQIYSDNPGHAGRTVTVPAAAPPPRVPLPIGVVTNQVGFSVCSSCSC